MKISWNSRMGRFTAVWLFCLLLNAPPVTAGDSLKVAMDFADALLRDGTDKYGPEKTSLWVQMIDLRTGEIPAQQTTEEWEKEMESWNEDRGYRLWGKFQNNLQFAGLSNLNWDGSSIRLMLALSRVTGNDRYRNAVLAYMTDFVAHCASSANGLFAWGVHMGYDVRSDRPFLRWHELNMYDLPPWEELLEAHPTETLRAIRAIYSWHIQDKNTYAFDRKAEFYVNEYTHETKPFWHHAPMFVDAFTCAYARTGDPDYWRWSEKLLTSLWSKRDPETDRIPGLWVSDRESTGDIQRYDAYVWPMEYIDRAYETCGEDYLLEILNAYLELKGKRAQVNQAREARVMLQASRLKFHPRFVEIAEDCAESVPVDIATPIMAFDAGHTLLLFVELFEMTGEEKWFVRAEEYADRARDLFVHESGLIAGTAGVERPLYYDVSQGPGLLATAFFRLGLLEQGHRPIDIQVDAGWISPEPPRQVTCRFPDDSGSHASLLVQPDFPSGRTVRFPGTRMGNRWAFDLPKEVFVRQPTVRFRVTTSDPESEVLPTWRYLWCGPDLGPPRIGEPVLPSEIDGGGDLPVSVEVKDPSGVESVHLRYTLDDRLDYPPLALDREGDTFTGVLSLPENEIHERVSVSVRAVDSSLAHNSVYSSWRELRVCAADTLDSTNAFHGARTGVVVVPRDPDPVEKITVRRYWWWPEGEGDPPAGPTSGTYYEIDGADNLSGEKEVSFPFDADDCARFMPSTLHFLKRNEGDWREVPTRIQTEASRLFICEQECDGLYAVSGEDRISRVSQFAETTCPMFLDLDCDGIREIVTGGDSHRVGALSATGESLWAAVLGTPFRQDGGTFSHVAGCDILGDGLPEIIIGSEDGAVRCFNSLGEELWTYCAHGPVRSGVAVAQTENRESIRIAFTDASGYLHLVDRHGRRIWERRLASECFTTPVFCNLDDGTEPELLCGTRDGDLHALNLEGDNLWVKHLDGDVSSPAVGSFRKETVGRTSESPEDVVILVGTDAGTLTALDPNGNVVWMSETPAPEVVGWNEPDVTMADLDGDGWREVVVASKNHNLHVFDSGGNEKWSFSTSAKINGGVAYADLGGSEEPEILFASSDGKFFALDGNGNLLWSFAQQGLDAFTYCIAGDIDGNRLLDVVLKTGSGCAFLRTDSPCPPYTYPWWTYRGNLARTGVW